MRARSRTDPRRRGLIVGAPAFLLGKMCLLPGALAQSPAADDRGTDKAEDPANWPFDQAGAVSALTGNARAFLAEETRPLSLAAPVFVGDLLRTEAQSRMTLALGARTTLRLGSATEIRLERYIIDAGGEISFANGAILFDREGTTPGEPLTVDGAYGLIAVRGTRFFAGPSEAPFAVFADRGSVSVTAGGREVVLNAGEGTEIAAPGDPPKAASRWSADRIAAALTLVA